MWSPKTFQLKNKKVQFEGRKSISVHELYLDDICLSNAVEFIDCRVDYFQLTICEFCGIDGCDSGNWVAIRNAGQYVILMPAFDNMLGEQWVYDHYSPPNCIKNSGAIYFTNQQYSSLIQLVPNLPKIGDIEALSWSELVKSIQWEAPYNMLGKFPDPIKFNKNTFLATSHDLDDKYVIQKLLDLLNDETGGSQKVELETISDDKEIVSFFFDQNGFLEWQPINVIEDSWTLVINPFQQKSK